MGSVSVDFDVLDAAKLIPDEILPLRIIGRMVLDRNVSNFVAETEQVAFCVRNVVPGVDFSNDPLLQGRIFSYLDTQLKRLGGPNFQQIPVNGPKCPVIHFQRDGHMQMSPQPGRVNNAPSSLAEDTPRQEPHHGLTSFAEPMDGNKLRIRSESFADHFRLQLGMDSRDRNTTVISSLHRAKQQCDKVANRRA